MKTLDTISRVLNLLFILVVAIAAGWILLSKPAPKPEPTTTTFDTLLVNEHGDTVKAIFIVDSNDVIYFVTSDRWQMMTPRRK